MRIDLLGECYLDTHREISVASFLFRVASSRVGLYIECIRYLSFFCSFLWRISLHRETQRVCSSLFPHFACELLSFREDPSFMYT